jgi:F-type H+-transporting ATPase subunit a
MSLVCISIFQGEAFVMKVLLLPIFTLTMLSSTVAFAAGGVQIINYYHLILQGLGLDAHQVEIWTPVAGALFTTLVLLFVGLRFKKSVDQGGDDVIPNAAISLRNVVELVLEFVHNIGASIIGSKECRPYLSVLFSLFLFIFVSNLSGLVPGFMPTTENFNTNLMLGLFSFAVFNAAGIKEHGLAGYLKTYAGPIVAMMPFIFLIEIIGAFVRPISLALRLYGNIFGDHLVLSVFTGLTYLVLPAFLLFFGLLVASIQSFVFTLLSSIYISLAISHDH